ncbi:MAG: hypothetical protein ACT4PG_00215 [Panacagrimonas sp.]
MSALEWWELLSYLVTVIGLPLAIGVFWYEQRKEHANDEEELYQRLSDEYASFLRLVLEHADLRLMSPQAPDPPLTAEQLERKNVLFGILISLFERAYLLVYEDDMPKQTRRLWQSWEDYMREWCTREDFRSVLPELLRGEDPDFGTHITRIAQEESAGCA